MQTFLPDPSYAKSAAYLDYKRLGKQRVEVKQLLLALGYRVGEHYTTTPSSWVNHPACKMWRGYEQSLVKYGIVVWLQRQFARAVYRVVKVRESTPTLARKRGVPS